MRRPADPWALVVEVAFTGLVVMFGGALVWALVEFYPG